MDEQLIKEKEQIIRDFGLEIEKVEDSVYKVLNTDKEFNIDKLQWALKECVLITSTETRYHRETEGFCTSIGKIYYIVIEINSELGLKYDDIAAEEFGRSLYQPYKYIADNMMHIDTIFSKEEIEFLKHMNKKED